MQIIFKLFLATTLASTSFNLVMAQDKTELVKKLVGLTQFAHPSVTEKRMAEKSLDVEKVTAQDRRNYAGILSSALKVNTQLNAEQKAFAQKNLGKSVERVAFEVSIIQDRNIDIFKWLKESLQQNYSAKLTVAELTKLIDYFGTEAGDNTLNYISASPERTKSGQPNYSPEEFLAYNDFVIKTPLGAKFFKVYVTDIQAELTVKLVSGNKQVGIEKNTLFESASLNQMINQFVTENAEPTKTDKSKLVNQLVETVIRLQNERKKDFDSKYGRKFDDSVLRANNAEIFNEALRQNKKLTADQLAFAKANYDKLHDILEAKNEVIAKKIITTDVWEKEDLTTLLTNYLSGDEVKNISAFLQTQTGTKSGNPESDKFYATATGNRYFTIINKELSKLYNIKLTDAIDKYTEATSKLMLTTEINKMINEFVASNYKK